MKNFLNANVEIHKSNEHSVVLRVYPDLPKMKYLPGQYGSLGLPSNKIDKLVKRAYSISSSIIDINSKKLINPDDEKYLEFYINRVLDINVKREQITPKIFKLNDGDRIFCGEKIIGHYTVPENINWESILFISTHTGESPNNSIINSLMRSKKQIKLCNINSGNNWESIYTREHETLESSVKNYKFKQFFDATSNYTNLYNYTSKLVSDNDLSIKELGFEINKKTLIMLCGDPKMIVAPIKKGAFEYEYPNYGLISIFRKASFEITTRFKQGNIIYESYWK